MRCKEMNLSKINVSQLFQTQFLRYSQPERVQGSFNYPLLELVHLPLIFSGSAAFVRAHQGESFVSSPALFSDQKEKVVVFMGTLKLTASISL